MCTFEVSIPKVYRDASTIVLIVIRKLEEVSHSSRRDLLPLANHDTASSVDNSPKHH